MMPECPQCGGLGCYLGTLGRLTHYRCRACGWTFDQGFDPEERDDSREEDAPW